MLLMLHYKGDVLVMLQHCNTGLTIFVGMYCQCYDLFFVFIDWSLHLPCYPPKMVKLLTMIINEDCSIKFLPSESLNEPTHSGGEDLEEMQHVDTEFQDLEMDKVDRAVKYWKNEIDVTPWQN